MKTLAILVLGVVIGCAAGGGYMYLQWQDALQKVRGAETSNDALGKTVKTQEEQLKQALAAKSSLETALKESEASKQAAERALKEAKDQLAQAQSAREDAERALAEAKKTEPK